MSSNKTSASNETPPNEKPRTSKSVVDDEDEEDDDTNVNTQKDFTTLMRSMILERWPNNEESISALYVLDRNYVTAMKRKKKELKFKKYKQILNIYIIKL